MFQGWVLGRLANLGVEGRLPRGRCADEGSAAAEAKAGAEAQLKARHVGERAARCWGARAGLSPSEATRAAITHLLQVLRPAGCLPGGSFTK